MIGAIALIALLLADSMVFGTLAELFAAGGEGPELHAVGAWAFCLAGVAGYAVPRFIGTLDIPERRATAITGAAGVLLVYLLVRVTVAGDVAVWDFTWLTDFMGDAQTTAERGGRAIVGGLLLSLTWARATFRSSDEVELESVSRSVAIPFALVTGFVVFGAATDRSGEIGRAGAAFYVFAILALACSQLALSGATFGEVRAGGTAGLLLAGTAGAAVVVLLVVGLVTSVLGPIIGPVIGAAVEWTLTIILTPFAWVLTRLVEMLLQGNNPFPSLTEPVVNASRDAGEDGGGERSVAGKAGLFLMRTLALLLMIGAAALLATVFVRLRKRRRPRLADGREASAAGDFRSDIGAMLRSLFNRRSARPSGYATTEATRLYLEVLAKAEHEGHPRPDGETAREFAPALQATFAKPVTDDITRAFEAARYAGRPPDLRSIEELRRRWEQESGLP